MVARKALGGIIGWDGSFTHVRYHSGCTDCDFGHHDYQNASGLGDYHFHHGDGPHLHPHDINRESLISLFAEYNGISYTTVQSAPGGSIYVFESMITLEKGKNYFTLKITGKNDDAFYLIADGET